MYIYQKEATVDAGGLSTRRLFRLLQEAAGEHSAALGFGEPEMRRRGLMWVVIRYRVEVLRYPMPGETLTVETWPGQTRHGFCPRYYRITDGGGAILLRGGAIWTVVDRETRKMVSPQERGVDIEPLETGTELSPGGPIRRIVTDREASFVVPEEYLDGNGHMNNTTYFDLAEAHTGQRAQERGLREVSVEYLSEALRGEQITVRWGFDGTCWAIAGESGNGPVFRMLLRYGE